jgi:hypothetical protein
MNKEYTQAVQDFLDHYNKHGQISESLIHNLENEHEKWINKQIPLNSDRSGLSKKESEEILYLMHKYFVSFDDAKEILQELTTRQHNDDV